MLLMTCLNYDHMILYDVICAECITYYMEPYSLIRFISLIHSDYVSIKIVHHINIHNIQEISASKCGMPSQEPPSIHLRTNTWSNRSIGVPIQNVWPPGEMRGYFVFLI